jgi:hypothetical protein
MFLPALVAFSADGGRKDTIGISLADQDPECETGCNNMGRGRNGEHYSFWDISEDARADPPGDHPKWHWKGLPGTCNTWHPLCPGVEGVPEEDIEGLALALAVDDRDAMIALVDGMADRVFLNSERSMVQALGCGGFVIANLPLSPEQLRALED